MKKTKRLIAVLLAFLLALSSCTAAAENMQEHCEAIKTKLNDLKSALEANNSVTANFALGELRKAVYNAAKYLASIRKFDKNVMEIIAQATEAVQNIGGDYLPYLNQAYAYTDIVLLQNPGEVSAPYIQLSTGAVTLDGSGYTEIGISIGHNCKGWRFSSSAGTLSKGGLEIPFRIYNSEYEGNGNEVSFTHDDEWDKVVVVYIDETDYTAAAPGKYTGEISCHLAGLNNFHRSIDHEWPDIYVDASIPLTLIIPGEAEYCVAVQTQPEEGGTVTGAGSYAQGANVALTAVPNAGWNFVEWQTVSGDVTVTNNQFTMPDEDVAVRAVFEMVEYPMYAIESDGAAMALLYDGWLSMDDVDVALAGEELTLSIRDGAEPDEGNYFTEEFTLDGVNLGSVLFGGVMTPVAEFTMPAHDLTIGAVQAARTPVTLDFTQNTEIAVPYRAMVELNNSEELAELFGWDEDWNEVIDLNDSGTPDLAVTAPDFETTFDYILTLLDGADATGTFTYVFSYMTDPYSPITIIMRKPAFGTPDFTLPEDIKTIEANVFEGDAATVVEIPYGCLSIGDYAFKDCKGLTQIRIPETCTTFGADIFNGCGIVFVYGPANSAAETYCQSYANCEFVPE